MEAVEAKCSDYSAADDGQGSGGVNGFMLFGVRVITEGSFRKSASMSNLSQFDQQQQDSNTDVATGYASDDVVHPSSRSRVRKRVVVPWSEEEHKLFLLGLQKVGKGDWRGISRNYVKTRTPTQVSSHAQKYFLRQNNHNRRRRRSSLFDITTETVTGSTSEEQMYEENVAQPPISQHTPCKILEKVPMTTTFPVAIKPLAVQNPCDPMESLTLRRLNQMNNSPNPIRPIPILPSPPSSKMANLDLNKTTELDLPSLSLNVSSSQAQPPPQPQPQSNQEAQPSNQQAAGSRHVSTFQGMPANFNGSGGDSIISVT